MPPKARPKSAAAAPPTNPHGSAREASAQIPTTTERSEPSRTAARSPQAAARSLACTARSLPTVERGGGLKGHSERWPRRGRGATPAAFDGHRTRSVPADAAALLDCLSRVAPGETRPQRRAGGGSTSGGAFDFGERGRRRAVRLPRKCRPKRTSVGQVSPSRRTSPFASARFFLREKRRRGLVVSSFPPSCRLSWQHFREVVRVGLYCRHCLRFVRNGPDAK